MYIKSINIKNFRTLKNFEIHFTKNYNLIIGKNNAGKSNILTFLERIFNDNSTFKFNDTSKINNTSQIKPTYKIESSSNFLKLENGKYYLKNSSNEVHSSTFKSELEKIKLIYIDIQKEYTSLIETVIKQYTNLDEAGKNFFDTQINIDFSEIMGVGYSLFIKEASIFIIDEYADTAKMEYKSSGVQRVALIICVINLFKVQRKLSNYILLVDEPEGNLHVRAQKKMYAMLKKFSQQHQVIISSHSTIFMQDIDFESINYIERNINSGSFVDNQNLGVDNFRKIRDALGLEISDTLFLNKRIIAVEGLSEVILHSYIYNRLYPNSLKYTFFTVEGANKTLQNVVALKQILDREITVILDNDEKGNEVKKQILEHEYTSESRVILQPIEEEGEIEDLFSKEFMIEVIKEYIKKHDKLIRNQLGNNANKLIEDFESRLEEYSKFSDFDKIGTGDNAYDLKGQAFVRYIKRMLSKEDDDSFESIVKPFISIYGKI